MSHLVYSETYRGLKIEIHHDADAESPRDWDNLGTIIYSSREYKLGDFECDIGACLYGLCTDIHPDFPEDQFEDHGWNILEKYYHILPVYAYIHGGIVLSTGEFSCLWDSGQCGFIYVKKSDVIDEQLTAEQVIENLKAEIRVFSDYLSGNCHYYSITNDYGDCLEACCGYIGDYDAPNGCLADAKTEADAIVKNAEFIPEYAI